MNIFIVIIFAITLIYFSIIERFRIYTNLIIGQGVLLFILSFIELESMDLGSLLFVVSETLIFKVIITNMLERIFTS